MKGKERKNLLEMEIEVMYAVKNMIKKDIKAGQSLCEIFKVIEDSKRVSLNFTRFILSTTVF